MSEINTIPQVKKGWNVLAVVSAIFSLPVVYNYVEIAFYHIGIGSFPYNQIGTITVDSYDHFLLPTLPINVLLWSSVVSLILGIVAYRQIKKSGERGLGLAYWAMIMGGFTLFLFLVIIFRTYYFPSFDTNPDVKRLVG